MSKAQQPAQPPEAPDVAATAKPAKRGWLKTVVLAVGAVAIVGGGAVWWMTRTPARAAAAADAGPRGLVAFEPFVVNLADGSGSHFLRASIQLVVRTTADAETVQKTPVQLMQARSALLELLSQQSASALVTPQGKDALKQAIATRENAVLGANKVTDVLFSEFVVQF